MGKLFVIGIGGTGIKTLIHVKRMLIDRQSDGQLPPGVKLLGIDTCVTPETIAGIGGGLEKAGRSGNYEARIGLASDEYLPITGQLGDSKYDWFDDRFFGLGEQKKWMDVSIGAGMYRQIGRLAFFHHIQGRGSKIYSLFENSLRTLSEGDHNAQIYVVICGSLAGGTGAGIFMDVGNVISKMITHDFAGIHAQIHGLFVLPEAFQGTRAIAANVKQQMYTRAYAALLEFKRMLIAPSPLIGSKYQYLNDTSNDPVLTGRAARQFYEFPWLFDESPQKPLKVEVDYGIAPVMANHIVLLHDDHYERQMGAHYANRDNQLTNADNMDYGQARPYVGSFGSYSVELPVAAIVENWTQRLGQEVLDKLLPIENKAIIRNKKGYEVGDKGAEIAQREWQRYPIPVARDGGKLGSDSTLQKGSKVDQIIQRVESAWATILRKSDHWEGDDENKWNKYWNSVLYREEGLQFGKKEPKGQPLVSPIPKRARDGDSVRAALDLISDCNRVETEVLQAGMEVITHQLDGQLKDFISGLKARVVKEINGENQGIWQFAIKNKSGKAGWLMDYLEAVRDDLDNGIAILNLSEKNKIETEDIENLRGSLGVAKVGAGGVATASLENQMKADDRKQKDYLLARQKLLEYKRWEQALQAEIDVLKVMSEYVAAMLGQVNGYVRALRTADINIEQEISDSHAELALNLGNAQRQMERVRKIFDLVNLHDEADQSYQWERAQYNNFTQDPNNGSALERVLCDVEWQIADQARESTKEVLMPNGSKLSTYSYNYPDLKLKVNGYPLADHGDLVTNVLEPIREKEDAKVKKEIVKVDWKRLRERCRNEFTLVWERLSVLGYLYHIYGSGRTGNTADSFAKLLTDNCDAMIHKAGGQASPTVTYLVGPEPDPVGEQGWVDSVVEIVKRETHSEGSTLSNYYPIENKSSIYYLIFKDMNLIDDLHAYQHGEPLYKHDPTRTDGQVISRKINHVLLEEQNTVEWPDLPRRVVDVMEDMKRINDFIDVISLGLLIDGSYEARDERVNVKKISIPPLRGEIRGGMDQRKNLEYILTNPESTPFRYEKAYLLLAANTFVKGSGNDPLGEPFAEMHSRLADYLEKAWERQKQKYCEEWINKPNHPGNPSKVREALKEKIKGRREQAFNAATKIVVYLDLKEKLLIYLKELQEFLEKYNPVDNATPSEILWMKDEIAFVKWIIERLEKKVDQLSI